MTIIPAAVVRRRPIKILRAVANPPRKNRPGGHVLGYEFDRFLTIQEMRTLRKLAARFADLKSLLRSARRVVYR